MNAREIVRSLVEARLLAEDKTTFDHDEPLENHINVNHPALRGIKDAVDRGAHKLTVKKVDDSHGSKRTTIEIGHHVPSDWKRNVRPYPFDKDLEHYDPKVAHVDHEGIVRPKDPHAMRELPKKAEPGVIYRGMSHEEYQSALKKGHFGSHGGYNIGDEQKGLTYFSSEPHQAQSYAHSYAPWQQTATPSHPAVVVAIHDRKNYEVHPRYPTELGMRGKIPTSEISHVYVGRPYSVRPGNIDVLHDRYSNTVSEGSRTSPSASLIWSKEHPKVRN